MYRYDHSVDLMVWYAIENRWKEKRGIYNHKRCPILKRRGLCGHQIGWRATLGGVPPCRRESVVH